MLDKFKDECGVFGIYGHAEAAKLTYLGLYALQHRGQESAGIVGGRTAIATRISRAMGYVADVFDEQTLAGLPGTMAHRPRAVLDGGREQARQRAADPHRVRPRADRHLATTATWSTRGELRDELVRRGRSSRRAATPRSSCISTRGRGRAAVEDALIEALSQVRGAFSLALLDAAIG